MKILLVGKNSQSTRIIYNYLIKRNYNVKLIIEKNDTIIHLVKRKIKIFGFFSALGQMLFILFYKLFLKPKSKKIFKKIKEDNNLDDSEININSPTIINSINSQKFRVKANKFNPSYILVSGTKIIGNKTIENFPKRIINIHAGITPYYRGVHGAYWSIINNDFDRCGVTLHFIDSGVDTGQIISQAVVRISKNDNFATYPFLQLSSGLKLLDTFLINEKYLEGINQDDNSVISNQYTHPTIFQYFFNYLFKGKK